MATDSGATFQVARQPATCHDCGLAYGSPGWIDAVVPNDIWASISPNGDEGGILCITCMARRCAAVGLQDVPVMLASGVFEVKPYLPFTEHIALAAELAETTWQRDAALALGRDLLNVIEDDCMFDLAQAAIHSSRWGYPTQDTDEAWVYEDAVAIVQRARSRLDVRDGFALKTVQELLEDDPEYQHHISDQGKAYVKRYLAYRQYLREASDDQAEILAYDEWLAMQAASGAADSAAEAT